MTENFCPVCGKKLHYDTSSNSIGIVEKNTRCPCGYYYKFAYGNYMEIIGKTAFVWDYTIYKDNNKFSRFFKKRKKVAFMTRRNYKKFHRNCLTVSNIFDQYDNYSTISNIFNKE